MSLVTLSGRIVVPFLMGGYQAERIGYPKGQSDLVRRHDGKWFLLITVTVPDGTDVPFGDFLGVDLGLAEIAADSDGTKHSGKPVDYVRRKHNLQRKRLQRKGTKGAKKKLRRDSKKRRGSAATRTTSSARRSSRQPNAPAGGSPSRN